MQSTEEFAGLGMPVFTAFGWAGEEAAQNYAYSQLEQFIALLHAGLGEDFGADMAFYGLSAENQSVYLAGTEAVEDDAHITFSARPISLDIELALTDKDAITRALKQITKEPQLFLEILRGLGPEWQFRLQQMQIDEESGDQGHYQDIYKGSVAEIDEENVVEFFEKAAYLNGDKQWATPLYFSLRVPAEQAAAMQTSIVPVMAERLEPLLPIVAVLRGRAAKKVAASAIVEAEREAPKGPAVIPDEVLEQPERPLSKDEFVFTSELRPLHIERGFINMTPEYWPFFAVNARTESRPVVVVVEDVHDEESAVWRLQPGDLARLVLGPQAHRWLEDNFVAGDYVQILATRQDDAEIQIELAPLA